VRQGELFLAWCSEWVASESKSRPKEKPVLGWGGESKRPAGTWSLVVAPLPSAAACTARSLMLPRSEVLKQHTWMVF